MVHLAIDWSKEEEAIALDSLLNSTLSPVVQSLLHSLAYHLKHADDPGEILTTSSPVSTCTTQVKGPSLSIITPATHGTTCLRF